MNVALWIVAGLLAVVFLVGGGLKVVVPKERIAAIKAGAWAEDFSPGTIRTIGVLEVLAAVGLILPAVTDVAPVLVPLAAVGLVLVMVGAIVTHLRRNERLNIVGNLVYLSLAAFVAWGRFGPESFTS